MEYRSRSLSRSRSASPSSPSRSPRRLSPNQIMREKNKLLNDIIKQDRNMWDRLNRINILTTTSRMGNVRLQKLNSEVESLLLLIEKMENFLNDNINVLTPNEENILNQIISRLSELNSNN